MASAWEQIARDIMSIRLTGTSQQGGGDGGGAGGGGAGGGGAGGRPVLIAAGLVLVVIVLVLVAFDPFYQVPSGFAGVETTWGSVSGVSLKPGLHLVVPVMQRVHMVSVQPHTSTSNESAATHDQQEVNTGVAVTYHVPVDEAPGFYTNFRSFAVFSKNIITPSVSNDVKAVTTSYNAEELISKRQLVDDGIKNGIIKSLSPYHVVVNAVNISNFSFSKDYMQSIEEKQIAQQKALKAKYVLQETKINAQQRVVQAKAKAQAEIAGAQGDAKSTLINAKADAQAFQLKAKALTPEVLKLEEVKRWNGVLPRFMGGQGPSPFLNLAPASKAGK